MATFRAFLAGLLALPVLIGLSLPSRAADGPMSDTERGRALGGLKWVSGPTSVPVGAPAARFDVGKGMMAATGDDAKRAIQLINASNRPETQATILVPESQTFILIEYADVGYVRMDDWDQLKPEAVLADFLRYNEKSNQRKRAAGLGALTDGHWEVEPQINRADAVVYWAISFHDAKKNADGLNVSAIRLGRRGYARMSLSLSMDNYEKNPDVVQILEKNFRFEPGATYADYVAGEKVAPFGVAKLVTMDPNQD